MKYEFENDNERERERNGNETIIHDRNRIVFGGNNGVIDLWIIIMFTKLT